MLIITSLFPLFLLFLCSHTIFYKFQVYCFCYVFERDHIFPQHPEWVSCDSLSSVLSFLLLELYFSLGHLERIGRDEDWFLPNCSDCQVRRISECVCSVCLSFFLLCWWGKTMTYTQHYILFPEWQHSWKCIHCCW